MLKKIIEWFNRNPCKECVYYNTPNNPKGWCQSKKCCNNGYGKVTKFDRLFCQPYKVEEQQGENTDGTD